MSGSSERVPVKHGIPTLDELEELGAEITEKWILLGLRLGVNDAELRVINQGHGLLPDKGYRMLKDWRKNKGSAATYQALYDGLKLVQLQDLAEKFCHVAGSKNPGLVNATIMSEDESWMGGKTEYLYGDQPTREELLQLVVTSSGLRHKLFEAMGKIMASDLQTSDSSGKALSDANGNTASPSSSNYIETDSDREGESATGPRVIPLEITVRGRLALEAYKRALAEGTTCDKRVPVMLIGQDRSGKTSLKKSLRGELFNPDEESTVGIEVDPSHFQVSTEIWKTGEKNHNSETSISFEYHAARAIVENLKKVEMVPSPKEREQHDSTPNDTGNQSNRSDDDPESVQAFRYSEQDDGIPKDIETEVVKRLKNDGKVEDEEDVHSVLWDFAGQSVYYTTHPLFLTSRAIYLLVNNLSQNPSEKAKPVLKQGMYRKLLDSCCRKTNFDYLEFWMSSIASLANQEESDQESVESDVLPEKLPAVFLVCTHADTPYESHSDPTTLAMELFGSLRTKPYKIHLYDLFVVDNTMSGHGSECPEVVRLRQEILTVSKALPQMKEAIPIKWLKYEKELQAMKEGGKKWIGRDTAERIASETCNITDDQEFQTLLNFLHDKRILIHFGDTPELDKLVVLDPQWLVDVFKEVITVRPCNLKERKFETLWDKLENDGILEEKLLERVWAPLLDHKETFESLIAIMEKFSLLCSWPSSDASCGKQYLVPSMLMSHPPEGILSLVASARIPPLFLKFESGQVPLGLFPRLVLQFFQWDQEEQGKPQLYHNFARFYTSQEEDCSVILLCHSSSIEVVVHQGTRQDSLQSELPCSADVSYNTCEVNCARAVRRKLGLILESIRNEFCWLKNIKYKVSFICPVCCPGGALRFCPMHATQDCAEEECLHFWPESQFCDVEKIICCTKSAAALSNRVDVKQFAPWFAPPRNELTVDKHNGGNLGNVQESSVKRRKGSPYTSPKRPKPMPENLAVKEGSPTNNDLEGLSREIINEWRLLGRRLLESDASLLDAIDKENPKYIEKAYQMLLKWKRAKGSHATFQVLHDALCHPFVDRRDLAETFCLVKQD